MAAVRPGFLFVLAAAVGLVLLAFAPAGAEDVPPEPLQPGADWPMYGASAAHNFSTGAAPPARLGLVWSFAGNGTVGSPVVSGGFVYVADVDTTPGPTGPNVVVRRLVEGNGSASWGTRIVSADGRALGAPHSLAVSGNRVFVLFTANSTAGNREVLTALDAATGQPAWANPFRGTSLWTAAVPAPTRSAPVVDAGLVAFGSQDGNVYGVDAATGALRWWFPTSDPIATVPAIAGGIVYVTSGSTLYYLDAAGLANGDQGAPDAGGWTGDLLFTVDAGARIAASPVVAGTLVYVDADGDLRAHSATLAGAPVWVQATPHGSEGTPAVLGNLILARRTDGRVYAYDRTSPGGDVVWVRGGLLAPAGRADLAAADGRVFLSARNGASFDLVTLGAGTGDVLDRNATAPRAPLGPPIVAGERVFVAEGGRLLAYRGQPDFTIVPGDVTLSLAQASGGVARGAATVTVRNVGSEAATARVRVYDGAVDPGNLIGEFTAGNATDPVAPGARKVVTLAERDWAVGRHDVNVVIDRAPTETVDGNNALTATLYVQAGPSPPPNVVGAGPYWVALLLGFAVGAAVLFFPIRRLRELRQREDEEASK